MTQDISTLAKLDAFAKQTVVGFKGGEVLALVGPLGAGKTTFVQYLGKHLGVVERLTSPTFTLMHIHNTKHSAITHLVHIDAYRLSGPAELEAIGVEDYLGKPGVVSVVEWGEKVETLLPKKTQWLTFATVGKKRTLSFTPPPGRLRQPTSGHRAP